MKQLKFITKLRGLIVLVLALMVSGNASATISSTAATSITSGSKYIIGYTSGSNIYYLTSSAGTSSTTNITSVDEGNAFTIEGNSTDGYTLKNGSNYLTYTSGGSSSTRSLSTSTTSRTWTGSISGSAVTFTYVSTGGGKGGSTYYIILSGTSFLASTNSGSVNLYEVTDGYSVTCPSVAGGTVTASASSAAEGATVTLTNTASDNFTFSEYKVTYTDGDGNTQNVTVNSDGTFTMPAYNVTVSAIFNLTSTTITPGDRPYAIQTADGNYLDFSSTTYDQYDGGYCINKTSSAYPVNFIAGAYTGGWAIKSAAAADSYIEPQPVSTGSNTSGDTWSTIVTSTSYDWTIAGSNSSCTIARADGKYIASSDNSTAMYCDKTTSESFTLVPLYIIWPESCTGGSVGFTSETGYQSVLSGSTVTLSNTAEDGYEFVSYTVTYTDGEGNTQTIDATSGSFTMPAYDVHITATFVEPNPKAVKTSSTSISLKPEATAENPFTVNADYITAGGSVTYSSSNTAVATVDATTGVITAVGEGVATITATATTVDGYNCAAATITVQVSTSHIPAKYSTTWTTSNKIYLYNKATGLYLSTGGHWGTEGLLKTTGLPSYLSVANSTAEPTAAITGVTMYSNSALSRQWGFVASSNSFDPIKIGLFCDATDNYQAQTFTFTYNSDDHSYSISRDNMTPGIEITYTDADGVKYYLAPTVNNFSTSALLWSTAVYYWSYDATNKYIYATNGATTSSAGTPYYLYYNSGAIGLQTGSGAECAIADDGTLTIGGYYLTYGGTTLTTDATNAASAKTYTDTSNMYLSITGTGERANIVTELQYTGTRPDEARWFVVTQQDLIDDFDNATASEAQPKEATFYLENSDFSRNVTVTWTLTDDNDSYSSPYTRFGDALYNYAGPTTSTNTNDNNGVEDLTTGTVKTTTTDATLEANGGSYTVLDADVPYAGVAAGNTTYYHAIYAGYYNCRILSNGTTTARKIYQRLTGLRQGWYKISCDGYKYTPTAGTGTATLYGMHVDEDGAQTGTDKESNSVALPEVTTYENMTQAGITFYNNGKTSDYRNSVMVYVPSNTAILELGVSVSGGTWSGNAADGDANTFAEVDAFQLQYTGDPTYDIVLDESYVDAEHKYTIGGESVDYINAQVYNEEGKTSRTLYLKRSMKANKWNSFTLPVNITAGSLKTAFGDNVELAAFDNCTDNLVTFTDVDLSTDTKTAMTAGKCYVIKPSSINSGQTTGTYSTKVARSTDDELSVTATTEVPVFIFNNVELTSTVNVAPDIEPTVTEDADGFTPTGRNDYNMTELRVQGTYFYNGKALLFGSYALSNGSWVRFTKKTTDGTAYDYTATNPSKGFRCWIGRLTSQTIDPDDGVQSKLTMVINGEEYEATDIEGITAKQSTKISDNRVFSVSGQLVGTVESMNKLPKGIYIINGKKYIVK